MNIIKAPRQRPKELPIDAIDEKGLFAVHSRDYAQRPLPVVPPTLAPIPVPAQMQQQPYQAPSQMPRRSRTTSQGGHPRSILKRPKDQSVPPMQASGSYPQSWPSAPQNIYSGHHTGHYTSVKSGVSRQQSVHQSNHYATQMERRRSTNTHSYSTARHQASDSPVSDEDEVRLTQIRTSNYIPAYITRVPMKPAAYALHDYLRPPRMDKTGRVSRSLYFDIAFDPRENNGASIRVYDRGRMMPIERHLLEQSACTHAHLTDMTIYHSDPYFAMWPVRVRSKDYIRIMDVFAAIYETLHRSIKPEDRITEDDRRHAEPHREKRRQYEYNGRQCLLRVDILRSHRVFAGIEQDGINYRLYLKSYADP